MGWAPKLASPSGETRLGEAPHEQGQVRLPVLPASLLSGFLPSSMWTAISSGWSMHMLSQRTSCAIDELGS